MDNYEAYSKLLSEIYREKNKLNKEKEKYQSEYEIISNASTILNQYKQGNLDIKILKIIFDKIKFEYSVEDLQAAISFIQTTENMGIEIQKQLQHQLNGCKKIIQNFNNELNKLVNIKHLGKISYTIKEIENEIKLINKILESIEEKQFTKILSEEEFNKFIEILKNSQLNDLEKSTLMYDLVLSNSNKMSLNSDKIKQQKKIKLKDKQKEIFKTKVDEIVVNEPKTIEQKNQKENKISLEVDEVVVTARHIIENAQIGEVGEIEQELAEIALDELRENLDASRSVNYYCTENFKTRQLIIVSDIKDILLPSLEKENKKSIIELIKIAVEKYKELELEIVNLRQQIKDTTKEISLSEEELELIENVKSLLNELNEILFIKHSYNQLPQELYVKNDELKISYKDYMDSLDMYDDEDVNIELYKVCYNDLVKCYETTSNLVKDYKIAPKEEMLEKGLNYYKNPVKNIIVFVDEDGTKTVIEDDILEDECLKDSAYKKILKDISDFVNYDFNLADDKKNDHKIKCCDNEKLLKEYKLKSHTSGQARIFYGRYNTNLSQVYPELTENPHILMIYKVAYGNYDGKQKERIYYDAKNRCEKNSDSITYIRNLMLTDWDNLNSIEAEKKKREIDEYLRIQCIKLGHLTHTYDKKKSIESGDDGYVIN